MHLLCILEIGVISRKCFSSLISRWAIWQALTGLIARTQVDLVSNVPLISCAFVPQILPSLLQLPVLPEKPVVPYLLLQKLLPSQICLIISLSIMKLGFPFLFTHWKPLISWKCCDTSEGLIFLGTRVQRVCTYIRSSFWQRGFFLRWTSFR